ncbi:MAG TPA: hypothetical protein VJR89_37890 [Polyangiales bacterium]|nr:hypothetical protein [Polyangiales bacterium]
MIALIRAAMCDLMPRGAALPGLADTAVSDFLHTLKRESGGLFWLGLVLGAWVYTLTPCLTVFVPLPSFLLPARLRDRHASRIGSSELYLIRQAIAVVRLAAGLCWGSDPTVRARFGLAPYPSDPGSYRGSTPP